MEYVLESLIAALASAIATACDKIGTGVLSLFTIDIGTSTSVFDTIFSSMGNFQSIFTIMAMVILAINAIWQLIQIMVSPQANETPISLVCATGVAGICIYFSSQFILVAESVFNKFYTFILTMNVDGAAVTGETNFNAMYSNMKTALEAGDASLGLGSLLIMMVFMLLIAYNFVMFLIEVVERYLVLGVLFYTSPLAFSLAGSKSTRPVFASWIRMVASQLFLMVCNVFFFRLFIMGFAGFGATMSSLATAHPDISEVSLCIVWCLILYGILTIGTKIDSYLGTLGLSAAQTGRGLAASLTASGLALRRGFSDAKAIGKGVAKVAGTAGRGASKLFNGVKNSQFGQRVANSKFGQAMSHTTQSVKHAVYKTRDDVRTALNIGKDMSKNERGGASEASLCNAMDGSLRRETKGERIDGRIGGEGMYNAAKDVPPETKDKWISDSFKINSNNTATWKDKDGNTWQAASAESLKGAGKDPSQLQGLRFQMTDENGNKRDYIMSASGPTAHAAMAQNSAAEQHKKDFLNGGENRSVREDPNRPGVWTERQHNSDGSVRSATQYSPASLYREDHALNSHRCDIGGQQYHKTDVTSMENGETRVNSLTSHASVVSTADAVRGVNETFGFHNDPTVKVSNVDLNAGNRAFNSADSGIFTYKNEANGMTYAVAPAAEYAINPAMASTAATINGTNNTPYVQVNITQGTNLQNVFVQRGQPGGHFVAPQADFAHIPTPPAIVQQANKNNSSSGKTGRRRKK